MSISLHVIADFCVKNFFAECNLNLQSCHISFLKVSGCNQCIHLNKEIRLKTT